MLEVTHGMLEVTYKKILEVIHDMLEVTLPISTYAFVNRPVNNGFDISCA
jgi:hypothetical protein